MDLVDIDKVLDNLELCEEENRLAAERNLNSRGAASVSVSSTSSLKSAPSTYIYGTNSNRNDLRTGLNDYCESVKALSEKLERNAVYSQSSSSPNDVNILTETSNHVFEPMKSRNLLVSCQQELAEYENEVEESKDVYKYTEKTKSRRDVIIVGAESQIDQPEVTIDGSSSGSESSESLTTSSPSTFSSGPSIAGGESSLERTPSPIIQELSGNILESKISNQQIADNETIYQSIEENVNKRIISESDDTQNTAEAKVYATLENSETEKIEEKQVVEPSNEIISSLAEGISSINLKLTFNDNTVQNYTKTTMTEEKALPEKSLKNALSSGLSENSDVVSCQQLEVKYVKSSEPSEKNQNTIEIVNHSIKPVSQNLTNTTIQPVRFSTFTDEISDGEMDSMLQEMDIDVDNDDHHGSTSFKQLEEKLNTAELRHHQQMSSVPQAQTSMQEKSEKRDNTSVIYTEGGSVDEISVDQSNGDSFSQASTVEFSELKNVARAREMNEEQHYLINSDEYSSSQEDEVFQEGTHVTTTLTTDDGFKDTECAVIANGDEQTLQMVDDSQHRPQRPTTLNLPALQSVDLYANAGQTPPGSEQTDDELPSPQSPPPAVNIENDTNNVAGAVASDPITYDTLETNGYSDDRNLNLGKVPPIWVPDSMATNCMQCAVKFTMIKRRHHCRACGKVLCSVCCSQKFKLSFLLETESRVCVQCYILLAQRNNFSNNNGNNTIVEAVVSGGGNRTNTSSEAINHLNTTNTTIAASMKTANSSTMEYDQNVLTLTAECEDSAGLSTSSTSRTPNPNNPMEYCSRIPPHKQVTGELQSPPSVIVPVGVLKKDSTGSFSSTSSNSSCQKTRKRKSVMFSDGIAPGSELAQITDQWNEPKLPRKPNERLQRNSSDRGSSKIPATPPIHSETHRGNSNDSSAMGLVAQLFRGNIPPIAAASTMNALQNSQKTGGANSPGVGGGNAVSSGSKVNSITNHYANDEGSKVVNSAEVDYVNRAKRAASATPSGPLASLAAIGCDENGCFIPTEENALPPIVIENGEGGCDFVYKNVSNNNELVQRLKEEPLKFALQKNFYVFVKIVTLKCCLNYTVLNFTTHGLHYVGNDELVIILEFDNSNKNVNSDANSNSAGDHDSNTGCNNLIPKDIFVHLNDIYKDAEHGNTVNELSHTGPRSNIFLNSRNYGGFIYIRRTFQCMQDIIVPENPYLIGILIHRCEVPWAKVFPLRLMLRLGAQYRYYPCPHVSIRNRESVYAEIAQTIINFLADFRNYTYTLPFIAGMYIHMEDRQTTVVIPKNRLGEVIKAINDASDHILAFGGNFSKKADGHLVCMQNLEGEQSEMYSYSTQAINIQGQPRKVTGASFLILNESLKSGSGLSGKCNIVEDGLMVQVLPTKMDEIRTALRNRTDVRIVCGPINAEERLTETVYLKWTENDKEINIGVKSPIDNESMEGITNMRVHASFNYANSNYTIRLTDIYLLQGDLPMAEVTRLTEQIARSTSMALVPFLDLLVASKQLKIGLRATLHQDNVGYEAGSCGTKLPPIYMNALDNHLIATLHSISANVDEVVTLELIFYILNL